tara:strand:- start:82 stop:516 length:435 start_codon:yes stop_codon:yes gene_type:complete
MQNNISILLVEDDETDIETVQRAFKKISVTNPLFVTKNGKEALEFLRHEGNYSKPEDSPRPGVILLDLNMPIMGGKDFLSILREDDSLKNIPVFVLTTSAEEEDVISSYNFFVAGYIVKPIRFEDFVEALQALKSFWILSLIPK